MGVEYTHYLLPDDRDFLPSSQQVLELVAALRRERWIVDPESPHFHAMVSELTANYERDKAQFEKDREKPRKRRWFRAYRPPVPPLLPFGGMKEYAESTGAYARTPQGPGTGDHALGDREWLGHWLPQSAVLIGWPVDRFTLSGLRYPLVQRPFSNDKEADRTAYELQLHLAGDFIYHTSEVVEPFDPDPCCPCGAALAYTSGSHEGPFWNYLHRLCPKCGCRFDPTTLHALVHKPTTARVDEGTERAAGAVYRFAVVIACGKWVPLVTTGETIEADEALVALVSDVLSQNFSQLQDVSP